jgi:hypothetical protein
MQEEIASQHSANMNGKTYRVLCEGKSKTLDGYFAGRTDGNVIIEFPCDNEDLKFNDAEISYIMRWLNKKRYENMFNNIKKIRGKHVIGKNVEVNQYKPNGEFVAKYDSIMNAQRHTNIYASAIGQCCLGKLKSAGGYVWKYADAIE